MENLDICEWCGDCYDSTGKDDYGYCSQDCIDAHNRAIGAKERIQQQAEVDPSGAPK